MLNTNEPRVTIWAERYKNHLAIDGKELKCIRSYSIKIGDDVPHGISEVTITFDAIVNDTTDSNNQIPE